MILSASDFLNAQEAEPGSTSTQGYTDAAGIRIGTDFGLSYKHFMNSNAAIEGILAADYRGFVLEGLFEEHRSVFKSSGFAVFFGGGGYAGVFEKQKMVYNEDGSGYYVSRGYPTVGIAGIVGLEYKIPKVPLTAGLDVKPTFGMDFPDYNLIESALTVRYILGRVNNNNVSVPR